MSDALPIAVSATQPSPSNQGNDGMTPRLFMAGTQAAEAVAATGAAVLGSASTIARSAAMPALLLVGAGVGLAVWLSGRRKGR